MNGSTDYPDRGVLRFGIGIVDLLRSRLISTLVVARLEPIIQFSLSKKELAIMLRKLLKDEAGFIVSAELVLIFTLVFCGVAVGVAVVRDALVHEFGDIGEAIGALDQSYNYRSLDAPLNGDFIGDNSHARCSGSGFNDEEDECDCKGIVLGSIVGKDDPSTLNNPEGS
jgi:hypothetical protein